MVGDRKIIKNVFGIYEKTGLVRTAKVPPARLRCSYANPAAYAVMAKPVGQ
jgi:hypothetical protein